VPLAIGAIGKAQIPWWVYVTVGVAAGVVVTAAIPALRRVIWRRIIRGIQWFVGLRVLSRAARAHLDQAAFDRRSAEVEAQRTQVRQPKWRLDSRDKFSGDSSLYWLENWGGGVASNVGIVADPACFKFEGDPRIDDFMAQSPNSLEGHWFKGKPTERGEVEGVTFTVTWNDQLGDPKTRDVYMPSSEIRAGKEAAAEEAWAKGRADGRAEIFREQEEDRKKFITKPRWSVKKSGAVFTLTNAAEDSVAAAVRIDPKDSRLFAFDSSAQWDEVTGSQNFLGHAQFGGEVSGIDFVVEWSDANNDRQKADVFLPGWVL
jgi:hypothetical protein